MKGTKWALSWMLVKECAVYSPHHMLPGEWALFCPGQHTGGALPFLPPWSLYVKVMHADRTPGRASFLHLQTISSLKGRVSELQLSAMDQKMRVELLESEKQELKEQLDLQQR